MGLDAPTVADPNTGEGVLMINLPNLITLLRIFLIPVFILIFATPTGPRSIGAAVIFLLASLTDLLDGYLARRWGQITPLGKFLDPIADKFLIIAALIMLVGFHQVAAWIAIVIISRELAVTGLRAIASSSGIVIGADEAGKYKMTIQTISIVMLVLGDRVGFFDFQFWGTVFLWIAMILAVFSGLQYFRKFWNRVNLGGAA